MEPPVDQKLLEDFLSLCRHRSFSHAAQERNVTQPAFSRRIRALEEWLGVVLFDRTALPVRLTAQGEQFLPVARDIVDRMAEARREFAAGNRSDGIVRLISLPTLSINVLPDLLFRVRQTCDQLRFVVNPFPQSVEEHFCALMEHQVDMLLTYRLDEYESDSEFLSHIESATVGRERFLPVVGSALVERLPSASPLPYLSYSNFSFANRIILPLYEKTPCELQSVYESSLSEGIVKMLEKGIGMAWVPETLVSEQLKRGTIRRIWEDRPDLSVEVDIKLYRNKTVHRAAIETFWKAILQ